jgi:hypothetical protein
VSIISFMKKRPVSPTKTERREKIALFLDNEQVSWLRNIQETDGVPVSVSIRKAVDMYIASKKKK